MNLKNYLFNSILLIKNFVNCDLLIVHVVVLLAKLRDFIRSYSFGYNMTRFYLCNLFTSVTNAMYILSLIIFSSSFVLYLWRTPQKIFKNTCKQYSIKQFIFFGEVSIRKNLSIELNFQVTVRNCSQFKFFLFYFVSFLIYYLNIKVSTKGFHSKN